MLPRIPAEQDVLLPCDQLGDVAGNYPADRIANDDAAQNETVNDWCSQVSHANSRSNSSVIGLKDYVGRIVCVK
jgi:hypothetical protein